MSHLFGLVLWLATARKKDRIGLIFLGRDNRTLNTRGFADNKRYLLKSLTAEWPGLEE